MPPPTNRLDINLSIVPSADERKITLTAPAGSTWKNRLGNLVEEGMIDDLLLNVYVDTGERPDETVTGAA